MYDHTLFLCLQISRSDIRPHVNWAVSLVIVDGHFNLQLDSEALKKEIYFIICATPHLWVIILVCWKPDRNTNTYP